MRTTHTQSRWRYPGIAVSVLMLWVMLAGCKKEEDTRSGVVGHLVVEGGTPEGATAMIFEDPSRGFNSLSVWNVTRQQLAVGFRYHPQVGFEWRDMNVPTRGVTPTATAAVSTNGDFNIAGQVEGPYILVVAKDGFGWTAPMAVNLNQPTVDVGTLNLYAEETLVGVSSGTRVLASDHHYVIPSDGTYLVQGPDTLRLQAGAVVRGGDAAQILVQGQGCVVADGQPDKWCVFTSDVATRLGDNDWEGIRFQVPGASPGFGRFNCTRFSNCTYGVRSDAASCSVDSCYFGNVFAYGVDVSNGKAMVTNTVFDHIDKPVRMFRPDSLRIEHSVIFSAKSLGADIRRVNGGSIYCNWFEDCGQPDTNQVYDVGVILIQDCQNLDISRNSFLTSWFGLNIQGGIRPSVTIQYNTFDRMQRVLDVRQMPSQGFSNPTFEYNCMYVVDFYNVFLHPGSAESPFDARNNYWNVCSEQSIYDNKVHDCGDDVNCACVEITPILCPTCPSGIGICAE